MKLRMTDMTIIVTTVDENGVEDTFYQDDVFDANGKEYAWLKPFEECLCEECAREHRDVAFLFRVEHDGDDIVFVGVEDELEASRVMKVYDALCEEEADD